MPMLAACRLTTVSSVLYAGETKTAYAVEYGRLYQTTDAGTSWNLIQRASNNSNQTAVDA